MHIMFFNQIDFDCPRLAQFIKRTPKLRALDNVYMEFNDRTASAALGVLEEEQIWRRRRRSW